VCGVHIELKLLQVEFEVPSEENLFTDEDEMKMQNVEIQKRQADHVQTPKSSLGSDYESECTSVNH